MVSGQQQHSAPQHSSQTGQNASGQGYASQQSYNSAQGYNQYQPTQESRNYSQQGNSGQQNSNSAQNYQNSAGYQNAQQQGSPQQNSYGQSSARTQQSGSSVYNGNSSYAQPQQQAPYGTSGSQPAQQNAQQGYGQQNSYSQTSGYQNQAVNSGYTSQNQNYYGAQNQQGQYGQPAYGSSQFDVNAQNTGGSSQAAPVMAIISLVLGVLAIVSGWFIVGGLLGIGAIVLGALGLRQSRQLGKGKGMSIAGIITGGVGIIVAIIATILFVLGQQTLQECQKVGTPDGNGNKVCQVGDNPDSRMTVPAQ